MLVFVYGTLKQGYGNHSLLAKSKFIKEDTVKDHTLILMQAFPYMIEAKSLEVRGEIYEVDQETMRNLDALEGYPGHYQKKTVTTKSGKKADVYYLDKDGRRSQEYINAMVLQYGIGSEWRRPPSVTQLEGERH